ncbi:hypothetical protein [Streptomyces sp. bgisy022]|uniref:hypothetical protein n=1 Tax=Streptomyces sp. bgisy022 TaxID=3413769 RepID=UPI003D7077FB
MSDLTPGFPLDDFDRITSQVRMLSPLETMFRAAEETLLATRPEGFEVEEIGRLALKRLPECEQEQALDELLYTYWEAHAADREMWARHDAGGSL